jgi:phosphopantetheine adenylyltransferase
MCAELMKKITKIESNHAKILEYERRRYERRIRKLTQLLEEEKQRNNCNGVNCFDPLGQTQSHANLEVKPTRVKEAQYLVAALADSTRGKLIIDNYT